VRKAAIAAAANCVLAAASQTYVDINSGLKKSRKISRDSTDGMSPATDAPTISASPVGHVSNVPFAADGFPISATVLHKPTPQACLVREEV
jgi:hypothetical protein